MSRKKTAAVLAVLSVPASMICFYATNLILSDVANMFYMSVTKDVISSLPIFSAAVESVIIFICIFHCGLYISERQRILKLNAAVTAFISVIGIITSVLTGKMIYGSFTAPYPFSGSTIISLVFHFIILIASVFTFNKCRYTENSSLTFGMRLKRGLQHIVMAVFIYYAFDRFGAVLWMPAYAQISTLHKTFFFYISLLLPLCLMIHHFRYRMNLYRNKDIAGIAFSVIYLAADMFLCAAVFTGGVNDTQFVSAVSPVMGIERLLGMPVISITHFIMMTLPIIITLAVSIVRFLKNRTAKV